MRTKPLSTQPEEGIKLKQRRELWGLAQEDLAKLAGVSRNLIAMLEGGNRSFTDKNRKKIYGALDIIEGQRVQEVTERRELAVKRFRDEEVKRSAEMDYSPSHFGDYKRLVEFRDVVGMGQMELATIAQVPQATLAAIESGKEPLEEPNRSKLWKAIFWMMNEKAIKEGMRQIPTGAELAGQTLNPFAFLANGLFGVKPESEIESLRKIVELQTKQIEAQQATIKTLSESTGFHQAAALLETLSKYEGWDQVMFLVGRLDKMERDYADLARLNNLRTSEFVAKSEADSLQEKIEQNIKRGEESE